MSHFLFNKISSNRNIDIWFDMKSYIKWIRENKWNWNHFEVMCYYTIRPYQYFLLMYSICTLIFFGIDVPIILIRGYYHYHMTIRIISFKLRLGHNINRCISPDFLSHKLYTYYASISYFGEIDIGWRQGLCSNCISIIIPVISYAKLIS